MLLNACVDGSLFLMLLQVFKPDSPPGEGFGNSLSNGVGRQLELLIGFLGRKSLEPFIDPLGTLLLSIDFHSFPSMFGSSAFNPPCMSVQPVDRISDVSPQREIPFPPR